MFRLHFAILSTARATDGGTRTRALASQSVCVCVCDVCLMDTRDVREKARQIIVCCRLHVERSCVRVARVFVSRAILLVLCVIAIGWRGLKLLSTNVCRVVNEN